MGTIRENFNFVAIAANQGLIPRALPSANYFQKYLLLWLWLAASNDAADTEQRTKQRRQRALKDTQPVPQAALAPRFG